MLDDVLKAFISKLISSLTKKAKRNLRAFEQTLGIAAINDIELADYKNNKNIHTNTHNKLRKTIAL